MAEQRLVDTNEVMRIAREYYTAFGKSMADLTDLSEVLEDCSTIEAKPVVHAHWKHHMQCSECGQVDSTEPNFCPYCGAQMDEESN